MNNNQKGTVRDWQRRVNSMTQEHQLTEGGRILIRRIEWKFDGEEYHQAWGCLFTRARQLGFQYSKHFKQFYKPLPPKPEVGARVCLTSTGATGTVTGYRYFDVLVHLDVRNETLPIGAEYLQLM